VSSSFDLPHYTAFQEASIAHEHASLASLTACYVLTADEAVNTVELGLNEGYCIERGFNLEKVEIQIFPSVL